MNQKIWIMKRIIKHEIIILASMILLLWFDEIFDIPYLIFGADKTPINWVESLFETICISIIGIIFIRFTFNIFKRIKHLEGILPVCSSCKKIRDKDGNWHSMESYIHERSDAEFSHGLCPECVKQLYQELE